MIIINNEQDLIKALNTRINILQFINICVRTILLHSLHNYINKDIHKYVFDSLNITNTLDKDLLDSILNIVHFSDQEIKIIENATNAYIKQQKIILNDNINLHWNENDLKQFFAKYLISSPYQKLIIRELNIIKNTKLSANLKDIANSNLQINESIPITTHILRKELHSMSITPLIYINGNIIWGNAQSTLNVSQAQREHHDRILLQYLNNESLHKDDIIHLSMDEWKQCDCYNMPCEYARLVTDDNIFIFMYGDIEIDFPKIGKIIYQKYNKPVFTITEYATHLKRIAKRSINKNNTLYIIRLY